MKVEKLENGIVLKAETDFEEECLAWVNRKTLNAKREDDWNETGGLKLMFESHPWDHK